MKASRYIQNHPESDNPFLDTLEWKWAMIALSHQIHHMAPNLLNESAGIRGEYLLADHGIPQPRPATACAWASMCAFGPIQGFMGVYGRKVYQWNPTKGKFLLPFLPRLLANDASELSLPRVSKAHARDLDGNIRWGNVYIASAESGNILESVPHGQRDVKEWMDPVPLNHIFHTSYTTFPVPPPYAELGDGYQFGLIQNIPGQTYNLRHTFEMLAMLGFLPMRHFRQQCPSIKKLYMRFLDVFAANAWAKAYSEAMRAMGDKAAQDADRVKLSEEIKEYYRQIEHKQKEADSKKTKAKPTFDFSSFPLGVAAARDQNKT